MKKLINDSDDVVDEMLEGMVAAYPDRLRRLPDTQVVVRDDAPLDGKVGVVSGGGSGHEPTHAGYIGDGMLDGAAAGDVFSSPTADEFEALIGACDGGEGVLAVVKNYEGDVMNFETAIELAEMEGTEVATVVVDDDVAVEDSLYTSGRRGVCGTIIVHRAVGAKAAEGGDLDEVQRVGQKVVDNVGTMGTALTSCVTPEKGEPTFDLGDDEIELGIGIHGEPGVERTDVMSADEITEELTEGVLDDLDPDEGQEVLHSSIHSAGAPLSIPFTGRWKAIEHPRGLAHSSSPGALFLILSVIGVGDRCPSRYRHASRLLDRFPSSTQGFVGGLSLPSCPRGRCLPL